MLFFIQTAVAGEGPHAQEVSFAEFIDAVREHGEAPVESGSLMESDAQAAWLRLDLMEQAND